MTTSDLLGRRLALRRCLPLLFLSILLLAAHAGQNDECRPQQPVQVLVGGGPGGSMDRTARKVNDGLQHAGLIPGGSEVVNRPGGDHSLALNALLNQPGDAKRIQVVNAPFITNKLLGHSPIDYRQFTPLLLLFSERFLFAVRNDFPIKDGKDLIAKLRASVSFSVSSGVGTVNYAAAMELAKAIGSGGGDRHAGGISMRLSQRLPALYLVFKRDACGRWRQQPR